MKLGIVGSREYKNEARIKACIQKYIDRYGEVTIVSGGCPDGADYLAKKIALEMGLEYVEFPPVHRPHNQHCVLPASDYNKPYHVRNYFARNTQIAQYSEHVLAFVVKGLACNGTTDTCKKADKLGKPLKVLED